MESELYRDVRDVVFLAQHLFNLFTQWSGASGRDVREGVGVDSLYNEDYLPRTKNGIREVEAGGLAAQAYAFWPAGPMRRHSYPVSST
ncbi:hypothetical protein LLF88_06920 [bacterium]|nr:hypothetical protein [bacterium]